ncbi:ABC transporter, partial [Methylobacterium sp. WL6]
MLRPVTGLALVASLVAPILGGCGGGAAPLTFDLMALP